MSDLIKENLIITRRLVSNPTFPPTPKPGPNKPVMYKIA